MHSAHAFALALAWVFRVAEPSAPLAETARLVAEAAGGDDRVAALALAVCAQESGAGTNPRAASRCGTRVRGAYVADARRSIEIAVRSLARRVAVCRTDERALVAYRYDGDCAAADATGYARRVAALARRIDRLARRAAAPGAQSPRGLR